MSQEITIKIDDVKNSCFVVMPFSALYQIEYENIIRPALSELNIECIRGDEIYTKQRIMDDIWESLKSCRLVIAELTGKNPNVLYEVGLAHALGKPVIILTRDQEDVPFDLKDLRYLFYDINDPFWGDNLKKALKNLIQKIIDSPEIDSYLSGITPINKESYPKIKSIKPTKSKLKKELINLEGNWKGYWENDNSEHNITFNLFQFEEDISAVGTITIEIRDSLTVVQQIFEGKVNGKSIFMQGVNYTYIERGNSENYRLDVFELIFTDGKLVGNTFDKDYVNIKYPITFEKITP